MLSPVGVSYSSEDKCLEGTRRDVLRMVWEWASLGDSNVFWVHGAAGSGKSTVAASVALMLDSNLAGSFFCKRDLEDQRKATNVIPTLVFRLAKALPSFGRHVANVIEREGNVGSSVIWQFEELLLGPLKLLEDQKDAIQNHVWVIDALDECYPQAQRELLIKKLSTLHEVAPWLKIFMSSRPYEHIHVAFKQSIHPITEVDMKDLLNTPMDIEIYMEDCLGKIAQHQQRGPYYLWLSDESKGVLLAKASKLFVWVSTMHKYLMNAAEFEASLHIILKAKSDSNDEFGDLYGLYSTVLMATDAAQFASNRSFIGKILRAIVSISRHSVLPPDALAYLLDANIQDVNRALANLEAVIYIDENDKNNIRVHHPSFLDYIENNCHPKEFQYSDISLNAAITGRCLSTLSDSLKFNICGLETSYVANKDINDLGIKIQKNISPILRYASLYWVQHMQDGSEQLSVAMKHSVYSILKGPKILYWMEILSLLGVIPQTVSIMEKLKQQPLVCVYHLYL